jgi:arylsulfatase A-like enzyme
MIRRGNPRVTREGATRAPAHLRLAIAALACFAAFACGEHERSGRMNVLLVTLDTTRADFLGAYGHPGDLTPSLDALARDGTRFDLAISAAAVTPVSHASILTGLYPFQHGLRVLAGDGGFRLPSDVPTIATILKAQGYDTAAIHSAFPVSAYFGLDRGFDLFQSFNAVMSIGPNGSTWNVQKDQRRSDETTDLALDYLKKARDPFFLWIHYWDPHDAALVPPPEFLPADVPRDKQGRPLPSRELYAAEVHYMDHELGRVVQALKKSGEYDHTLIAIVADHGEGLGDHGWESHRILYQEQVRVPLIVRVPGVHQVASSPALVRTVDILPTVLDYLALPSAPRANGASLRNLLEGRPEPERTAYADQINALDLNANMVKKRPLDDFLYCAMDAHWKLVYRPTHPEASELYRISDDPHETSNLWSRNPEEVARLERELARLDGWVTKPFPPIGSTQSRAGAQRALNNLGYAGKGGEEHQTPENEALRGVSLDWSWTCPVHPDVIAADPGKCTRCGEKLIPVRKKS